MLQAGRINLKLRVFDIKMQPESQNERPYTTLFKFEKRTVKTYKFIL